MSERAAELHAKYEERGRAEAYARERWRGTRHGRRTDRRERRLVAALLEEIGPCAAVLDAPCGAGRFRELLSSRCRRLVAVDAARAMLARAGAPWRVQAAVERLPLPDACVDLVFCFRLLHHYPGGEERRAILRELARVSRRHVLVSYFSSASWQAWRHRLLGHRTARHAQRTADFLREAAAAGLRLRRRRFVARGVSEQVIALLEKQA